jgi:hypothetical protein
VQQKDEYHAVMTEKPSARTSLPGIVWRDDMGIGADDVYQSENVTAME